MFLEEFVYLGRFRSQSEFGRYSKADVRLLEFEGNNLVWEFQSVSSFQLSKKSEFTDIFGVSPDDG